MRYVVALMLVLALGAAAFGDGLDLPIEDPHKVPAIQHRGQTGDPRDEPPPTIYGEEIDTEVDSLVYVLDISCSMTEDYLPYLDLSGSRKEGPRIDRAKVELLRSIAGLPKNFKFSVVAYSCSMKIWSKKLLEANSTNKASAAAWVSKLEPTDATGTGPAVAVALSLDRENKAIVLLTDGAPNCGTAREMPHEHRKMINDANTQRAVIDVFGIAARNDLHIRFCQEVASDSLGRFVSVP